MACLERTKGHYRSPANPGYSYHHSSLSVLNLPLCIRCRHELYKGAIVDPSQFTPVSPGRLTATIEGCRAFVPAPLPPELDLAAISVALSEALQAIGELRGACRRLSNPYLLVKPLQRREALTSSAMEGTFTTDDELVLAEAGLGGAHSDDTREVVNYIRALEASLHMLETLPLSHRVIRRAHEILLGGLSPGRGAAKRPGEYRRDQNWIGGRTIDAARFVPPPPRETLRCMDQLESYINRDDASSPLPIIDLALVHYQIEAIHPFADGNGRVGRMLISLMAVQRKLLDSPILYMSPAFETDKDAYIDAMFDVSVSGNWTGWIRYFLEKLAQSCRDTIGTVDRLIDLQAAYRLAAGDAGRSGNLISLVDYLFASPAITVRNAQDRLSVTYRAAKMTIDKLVELDILVELGHRHPKVFVAPTILRLSRGGDH